MPKKSLVGLVMKADIFEEPVTANYINYKEKKNYKTSLCGFMSAISLITVGVYFTFKLVALFGHQANLQQE
jgi:hypothetical protein